MGYGLDIEISGNHLQNQRLNTYQSIITRQTLLKKRESFQEAGQGKLVFECIQVPEGNRVD